MSAVVRRATLGLAGSAEEQELAETVRRFLAEVAPLADRRQSYPESGGAGTGSTPVDAAARQTWRRLAELGVAAAVVAADRGGLGLPFAVLAGVCEQSGRALYPGPVSSTAAGAASAAGDEAAGLADGTRVPVLAVPAGAGSPARERGDRLDARLPRVAHAHWADVFLVAVDDGLAAVDRDDVTVDDEPSVDASRGYGTVVLSGAPFRLVADPATARLAADRLLAAVLAEAYGAASAAYELALEHARSRVQFGRPIGSFQAVQHLLVDAYRTLEVGRLAIRAAFDAPSADELHRAVTVARALTGTAFLQVGATAIQVLGGIGYTWEHDVHLYYRRLLDLQTAFGPADRYLAELAGELVPVR